MKDTQLAYQLRILFDQKITSAYWDSYKGQLGKVQIEVLDYLYNNRIARVYEIAENLNIPKQHASKILSQFEQMGFVNKKPDAEDKRGALFSLTESGIIFIQDHISYSDGKFLNLMEQLECQERENFADAMRIMVTILEKL